MTKQVIIEKVNALLVDEFEMENSKLTPEATLKNDYAG